MNVLKLSLVAAAASLSMAGAAAAQDITWNVGAATDYIFRGVDQTGALNSQVFGGADVVVAKDFYLGAWVSDTANKNKSYEYDLYAGWKPALGPVTLDIGAVYYGYTDGKGAGASSSASSDYELKLAASIPAGGATLGAAAFYGPDNDGFTKLGVPQDTLYLEANAAYTFGNKVTLSGAFGNFDASALGDYSTWNVGVTVPVTEKVSLDARYIGTDDSAGLFNGAIATIKASF